MADLNRNRPNQQSQQSDLEDPSGEIGQSRGRSNKDRPSSADDRGMDESQRMSDAQLDDELDMESDLDDRDTDRDESDR